MMRRPDVLESLTVNLSGELLTYSVQTDEPAAMIKLLRYYAPVWA